MSIFITKQVYSSVRNDFPSPPSFPYQLRKVIIMMGWKSKALCDLQGVLGCLHPHCSAQLSPPPITRPHNLLFRRDRNLSTLLSLCQQAFGPCSRRCSQERTAPAFPSLFTPQVNACLCLCYTCV